jgi:hypothetical protein
MAIKAALLDAQASSGKGVFLRIDEVEDASKLTDRHVPAITHCDLEPGVYVWIASDNPKNEYGGAFWATKILARLTDDARRELEHM